MSLFVAPWHGERRLIRTNRTRAHTEDAHKDEQPYTRHRPIHTTSPRSQVIYFVVPVSLGMTVMSMVTEGGSWHQGVFPSSFSFTKPSPFPSLLISFQNLDDMPSAFTMPWVHNPAPCIYIHTYIYFAIPMPSVPEITLLSFESLSPFSPRRAAITLPS